MFHSDFIRNKIFLFSALAMLLGSCSEPKVKIKPGIYVLTIPKIDSVSILSIDDDLSWTHELKIREKDGSWNILKEKGIATLKVGSYGNVILEFKSFSRNHDPLFSLHEARALPHKRWANVNLRVGDRFLFDDEEYGYIYKWKSAVKGKAMGPVKSEK